MYCCNPNQLGSLRTQLLPGHGLKMLFWFTIQSSEVVLQTSAQDGDTHRIRPQLQLGCIRPYASRNCYLDGLAKGNTKRSDLVMNYQVKGSLCAMRFISCGCCFCAHSTQVLMAWTPLDTDVTSMWLFVSHVYTGVFCVSCLKKSHYHYILVIGQCGQIVWTNNKMTEIMLTPGRQMLPDKIKH